MRGGAARAQARRRDAAEERVEEPIGLNEQRLAGGRRGAQGVGRRARARPRLRRGAAAAPAARASASSARSSGIDVSSRALEIAARRLRLDRLATASGSASSLLHGSLIYRDARLAGFDAAAVVEVIEHLDPLAAGGLRARRVRPRAAGDRRRDDAERRVQRPLRGTLPAGRFRHADHRFEWTRAEFEAWAGGVCERHGYTVAARGVGADDPEVGAPTQMAVFTPMKITIPKLSPGRADRRVRLGQVDVRPRALQADRGDLVGLLPRAGLRRRERPDGDRRRVRRAALHRREAARRRPADGDRRHQRPAPRTARPLVELARRYHVPARRDRARPARGAVPRAQPAAARTATSARTSCAASRAQLRRVAARAAARGLPPRLDRCARRPRSTAAVVERAAALERPPRRARPVRHHRRRPRLLRRARRAARGSATTSGRRGRHCASTRKGARRSSSATWSTAAPTSPASCAWSWRWSAPARAGRARQPRRQARPQAARPRREDHPRPRRDRSAARSREPGRVPRPRRPRSSTAWSATTCSTAASWSSPTPG